MSSAHARRRWRDFSRRAPGRATTWGAAVRFWFGWSIFQGVCSLVVTILYGLRLEGREHIPPTGPVIYIANHQSYLDLAAVGALVRDRPFTPMARVGLWRSGFMRWVLWLFHAIPVDAEEGITASMKAALRELDAGRCVLIFPEGSRSPDGTIQPFLRGVLVLIRRAGAPVVPIGLRGFYDAWPAHQKHPGGYLRVRVAAKAGPPIDPTELPRDAEEALGILRARVEALVEC